MNNLSSIVSPSPLRLAPIRLAARTYSKQEVALRWFCTDSTTSLYVKRNAVRQMRSYIRRNPDLEEALITMGYTATSKTISWGVVQLLLSHYTHLPIEVCER